MALLGLIGGPALCAGGIAVLFDVIEPDSAPQVIATAPEFVWGLSLGIYLLVKGFKPSHHRRRYPTRRSRLAFPGPLQGPNPC
jgi:hypothetical protein